jgi:hypothetical protein
MSTVTDLDTALWEGLIRSRITPCEAKSHQSGQWGHNPDEGAAWIVSTKCGISLLICDAWVRTCDSYDGLDCVPGCEKFHPWDEVAFVKIP